jgi:hypothetical protein
MKLQLAKGCKLIVKNWHSINLIPHLHLYNIVEGEHLRPIEQVVELTIFGIIVKLAITTTRRVYIQTPWIGPCYSRRRKVWYQLTGSGY